MIYTSAFWMPKVKALVNDGSAVAVGITLFPPRSAEDKYGYKLTDNIRSLAPDYKTFGIDDLEKFRTPFRHLLHKRQYHIFERLAQIAVENEGKDIILLCFDPIGKEGQWCHRQLVMEWLNEKEVTCTEL